MPTGVPGAWSDDPLAVALSWRDSGRQVAVATVIRTWGSSPLPVGSQLVADSAGNFAGSVSGGCVEGAVIEEALQVIATGRPRLLKFGVTDERAWEVGLACGGEIEIFVDRLE
jgi:xanthine/CO dehydrogenase XdhC/CoxF family maturation factor